MFFCRIYMKSMGGGGEKILPVSLSFRSNLKFFKIISLAADYVDGK